MRLFLRLAASVALAALTGCGSVRHLLPGHSHASHVAPVQLRPGERRLALAKPVSLTGPGGFELTLASEDPEIVEVERVDRAGGAADTFLVAGKTGRTTVHYTNRYTLGHTQGDAARLRERSIGAFEVRVGAAQPPMPGSDTKTPHRFSTSIIGTAILQDVRDGLLRFDFTPDDGPTESQLRVRAAEIDDLRDTLLEPGTRLRLRLVREFLQLGTTTPRETSRRWEALRTR